uniref:MARVEL domain-containing protein n=1 Tax=Romanomermis culicivorax TaxID=13658 RepID=A0A915HP01_ROMCU
MEKGAQQPQAVTYTAPIRSGVSGINEDDPRYKCCCGVMHVRTGAMVLAIVELVFAVLGVLGAVSGGGGHYKSGTQGGSFFNGAVTILVCSLMLYGLRKTSNFICRRYFLVPHMVFQVLAIIACFIFAVIFIIGAIGAGATKTNSQYGQYRSNDDAGLGSAILGISAVIFALIGVLEIWFFLVVLGAFRYLRDKETAGFQGNPMVQYGGGNV